MENREYLFQHTARELKNLTLERERMEKDFNPSLRREYLDICGKQAKTAAELVKYGADFSLTEQEITVFLSKDIPIRFKRKEMREAIGEEEYQILFRSNLMIREVEPEQKEKDINAYMMQFIKVAENWMRQNGMYAVSPYGQMGETMEKEKKAREILLLENEKLQDEVKKVEEELDLMKRRYKNAVQQYNSLKEEAERVVQQQIDERLDAEKKLTALQRTIASENKREEREVTELKDKLSMAKKASDENRDLKQRIESLRSDSEQLKKKEAEIKRLSDTISTLRSDLKQANETAQKLRSDLDRKSGSLEVESSQKSIYEKQVSELKAEIHSLKQELSSVRLQKEQKEKELDQIKAAKASLENEASTLKEENETLSKSAYMDKFDVGNYMCFLAKAQELRHTAKTVGYLDIHNMRAINRDYGEETGDKVIRIAIEVLSERFGEDAVFRNRGAQFMVLTDKNVPDAKELFLDVQKDLETDDIRTVFGLASLKGRTAEEALKKAEQASKSALEKEVASSFSAIEEMEPEEPEDQEDLLKFDAPEIDDDSPINPNMARMIGLEEEEEDEEPITEIDATNIDIAKQIVASA